MYNALSGITSTESAFTGRPSQPLLPDSQGMRQWLANQWSDNQLERFHGT